jgi:hypothetical protein
MSRSVASWQFAIQRQFAAVESVGGDDRDIVRWGKRRNSCISFHLTHPWSAWRSLIQKNIKL